MTLFNVIVNYSDTFNCKYITKTDIKLESKFSLERATQLILVKGVSLRHEKATLAL